MRQNLFVRYVSERGKNLRGLYILKSETDSKRMEWLGNMFTHYQYTTTDINVMNRDGITEINSGSSGFKVSISSNDATIALPADSPFADWKEARRFAGPLPFTFTYFPQSKKVLIIEGMRENWKPKPIAVVDYHFSFLDSMHLKDVCLANAFSIEHIPYYWKKGRLEQWTR